MTLHLGWLKWCWILWKNFCLIGPSITRKSSMPIGCEVICEIWLVSHWLLKSESYKAVQIQVCSFRRSLQCGERSVDGWHDVVVVIFGRERQGRTDGDFDTAAKGARARGKCQPREILGVVDAIWLREGARVNLQDCTGVLKCIMRMPQNDCSRRKNMEQIAE